MVQQLCVMKVKENVLTKHFYDFNSGLVKPENVCVSNQMILELAPIFFLIFVIGYLENFALCHLFHHLRLCSGVCACFLILLSSPLPYRQYFFPACDKVYIFSLIYTLQIMDMRGI